jgi:hypothetical protein
MVQGDGIDDFIQTAVMTNIQYTTNYLAVKKPFTSSAGQVFVTIGSAAQPDNHTIWHNASRFSIYNGAILNTTDNSTNRLLVTANYNGVSSSALINNAGSFTGNTGANIGDIVTLFAWRNASGKINSIITTYIVTVSPDNSTVNISMYNFIKTLNNNAF